MKFGREKNQCTENHHPWKNADRKEHPGYDVKNNHEKISVWSGFSKTQKKRNRKIVDAPEPAKSKRKPGTSE